MCRFVTWWGGPGGIEAYRTTTSFSALTLSAGSFDPQKPVPGMTYNVLSGTLNPTQSKSINFSLITPPLSFRPCLREATHLKTGKRSWRNRRRYVPGLIRMQAMHPRSTLVHFSQQNAFAGNDYTRTCDETAESHALCKYRIPLRRCHFPEWRWRVGDTVDPGQFIAMGRQRLQEARASLSPERPRRMTAE